MIDRPVLGSCLLSGGLWLLPLVPWGEPDQVGGWSILLAGATYVVAASAFLARGHSGRRLSAAWAAACAVWTLILLGVSDSGGSVADWAVAVLVGAFIGSACFVVWQVLALVLRQPVTWLRRRRSGRVPEPAL